MHYIRFLKPPRLYPTNPRAITSKLTISTDLGESFLFIDVWLCVDLEDATSGRVLASREFQWKGNSGMRALEVVVPFPARSAVGVRMVVRPKEEIYSSSFETVLEDASAVDGEEEGGRIVSVKSMLIDISGKRDSPTGMAERTFGAVHIWEETGESIARHIWDAGFLFSAYIARICTPTTSVVMSELPLLQKRLQSPDLKVLELGAGCGIVGLTLSTHHPSISKLVMTDLPEAIEILTHNLSLLPNPKVKSKSKATQQVLDWSLPLPPNIWSTAWDLVFVADCTYNPDVVPDLVKTLRAVVDGNREGLVALAMKVRHESEMVFFRLMEESRFFVRERCKLALPVLGGEGEEIEIIVFGLMSLEEEVL